MRELQQRISSAEFAELMAEERLEPRGEWRMDLRFAMLGHLIAACWSKNPPSIAKLMPRFGEPIKQQSVEDMKAAAMAMVEGAKRAHQRGRG